jgi:regulatory protein
VKQKKPKKITPTYLENAALFYLERFSTSVENFRRVMRRKVDKSARFYEENTEQHYPLIEDLIERYKTSKLLNDDLYAESKTRSLRRQGNSSKIIQQKLFAKGLSPEVISNAMDKINQELKETNDTHPELVAAERYAKRRRLGPYRTRDIENADQKDLASLARAGFSYEIAKQVLQE